MKLKLLTGTLSSHHNFHKLDCIAVLLLQERGCPTEHQRAVDMETQLSVPRPPATTWSPLALVQHPTRLPVRSGEQGAGENASSSGGKDKNCKAFNDSK